MRQLGSQPCWQHTTTHAPGWWFVFSGIRLAMIPKRGGATVQDEEQWRRWWTGSRLWTGAAEEVLDWKRQVLDWIRKAVEQNSSFRFHLWFPARNWDSSWSRSPTRNFEWISAIWQRAGSVWPQSSWICVGQSSIPWCGGFIWGPGSLFLWVSLLWRERILRQRCLQSCLIWTRHKRIDWI